MGLAPLLPDEDMSVCYDDAQQSQCGRVASCKSSPSDNEACKAPIIEKLRHGELLLRFSGTNGMESLRCALPLNTLSNERFEKKSVLQASAMGTGKRAREAERNQNMAECYCPFSQIDLFA